MTPGMKVRDLSAQVNYEVSFLGTAVHYALMSMLASDYSEIRVRVRFDLLSCIYGQGQT